jgi:hypothetical protein
MAFSRSEPASVVSANLREFAQNRIEFALISVNTCMICHEMATHFKNHTQCKCSRTHFRLSENLKRLAEKDTRQNSPACSLHPLTLPV